MTTTRYVVRVTHVPDNPKPYTATVAYGPVVGSGQTPRAAIRGLHRGLIRAVRAGGLPEKLATMRVKVDAIRTFLPSAIVDGPVPETGSFLLALPWNLRQVVTALTGPELRDRARALGWEQFETNFLHEFPARWNADTAAAFNRWFARREGHPEKPVAVAIRPGSGLLGQHGAARIRIQRGLTPLATWQVFLHELAHYRVTQHSRTFALELARVYALWRTWFARRSTSGTESPRAATVR